MHINNKISHEESFFMLNIIRKTKNINYNIYIYK